MREFGKDYGAGYIVKNVAERLGGRAESIYT